MSTNINLIESLTANREKQERVNESLAKQLQRSMELNARMKNKLRQFLDTDHQLSQYRFSMLEAVINDKESP